MEKSSNRQWPNRPFFDLAQRHAEYRSARHVLIPAPYERTVTYGRGAASGPRAMLQASWNVELYDVIQGRELHHAGIHGLAPLILPDDPKGAIEEVRKAVARELDRGKRPVVLGGEHSLTAGAVAAAREEFRDLSVLQLDAHADLRDTYEGTPHSHACVMRRVAELDVPLVPVGIRSMSIEEAEWIEDRGLEVFFSHEIRGSPDWVPKVIANLSDEVYMTLDIDVLDPSEMPATGTPEPGGLSYWDIVALFTGLRQSGKEIIAADLMELAPIEGLEAPNFLAAKLLYAICGL